MPNRLAGETSPYLRQHRDNPVDWYPWGDEALARARAEDRPIFLSIGYSACHWCHVMERESFEDDGVAAFLNEHFVPIKVDREERPDLDSIYMQAVQQMTGSGGWPMSVFLTPDLKPFFGGTYFPPTARYGMPGFLDILGAVAEAYRDRRVEVEANAGRVAEVISAGIGGGHQAHEPDLAVLDDAAARLKPQYDPQEGGFGQAPKFPQAMALEFLLRCWRRTGDRELLEVVERSLVKMAHGGIFDQLGGGFHRYSTDARWLVPHFEKMLYDQALLAPLYLHAYQATDNPGYLGACTRTIDYVLRDMTSPEGGFYSAEDADSDGVEGLFYTWTAEEVAELLGDDYEVFARTFDVSDEGNWEGRSILHVLGDRRSIPETLGIGEGEYRGRLESARERLLAARDARTRPARDDKVLTGWNGLMLAAIAEAAAVLDRADYLEAAQRNATMLLARVDGDGRVLRTTREGQEPLAGYLEDYACLAHGLLALYQADFDPRWYTAAEAIARSMLDRFRDPEGGVLYSAADEHRDLLFRPKDWDDNAVPAGNSMAAEVLVELSLLSGEGAYRDAAVDVMSALTHSLASHPLFFGRLLSAVDTHLSNPMEVAVVGDLRSPAAAALLREVRSEYLPAMVLAAGPPGSSVPPLLGAREGAASGAVAYVCRGFVCSLPVTSASGLRQQMGLSEAAPEGFQAV
ncbi:MAG: uncharacterized protein QOE92_1645 [Chloroflexota bacterium]|nr:uncharacterized protein [Chloroflexota bacterium]